MSGEVWFGVGLGVLLPILGVLAWLGAKWLVDRFGRAVEFGLVRLSDKRPNRALGAAMLYGAKKVWLLGGHDVALILLVGQHDDERRKAGEALLDLGRVHIDHVAPAANKHPRKRDEATS